jgi:hypothetical protein
MVSTLELLRKFWCGGGSGTTSLFDHALAMYVYRGDDFERTNSLEPLDCFCVARA